MLQMVDNFVKTGRRIVFDNFFTSVPLCTELLKKGLSSIGTLRKNKKEIPTVFQTVTGRESKPCIQLFCGELMLTSWVPKKGKHILLLSTDPEAVPSLPSETKSSDSSSTKETTGDVQPKVVSCCFLCR